MHSISGRSLQSIPLNMQTRVIKELHLLKSTQSCLYLCIKWKASYIQGLSELADQNNTVKSPSSGNNSKNI
jgi:hypothetical protein